MGYLRLVYGFFSVSVKCPSMTIAAVERSATAILACNLTEAPNKRISGERKIKRDSRMPIPWSGADKNTSL